MHEVLACSAAERCKQQSTCASAASRLSTPKSEHSNGRRRRTRTLIHNRFSLRTKECHTADAQHDVTSPSVSMSPLAGPDKKVHK